MRAPIDSRQRAWIALGALALAGCTTWRVQSVAPIVFLTEAKPGKVRIQQADGSRVVLTQPTVVGDSIRGRQGAVAVTDVSTIAVRRVDGLRTLGLVGGMVVAIGVGCTIAGCVDFTIPNLSPAAQRIR